MFWASSYGLDKVEACLKVACDFKFDLNLATTDGAGLQPIHLTKSAACAELLIANGANVNAKSKILYTPLHFCAQVNNAEVAQYFVTHGADLTAKSDDGLTALQVAKEIQAVKVFKLLQEAEQGYRCSYCNQVNEQTMWKCSVCKKVKYCDAKCQKEHWRFHKQDCKKMNK